jgi:ABC-2 type transport system permease protein
MFEEKQTKTLHALLISPASIGQVVWGKAIAGMFYIVVTAALVYIFSWSEVVHWEIAILFAIANGIFGVAIGLVLGSFFESQQEVIALTTIIMLLFIGALFIHLLQIDVPAIIETIIPWIPSIGLANISHLAFTQSYSLSVVCGNLISTIVLSGLLFILVAWKISRSDV